LLFQRRERRLEEHEHLGGGVEQERLEAVGDGAESGDRRGASGGNGGECVGGRRVASPLAALLATALDPAMAARTDAVEVIAVRVGTVAVEVDADRTTARAARTAAIIAKE
jgi:hypothetical protein